jgi:hypothetical protein
VVLAGAVALYDLVKPLVARPRAPAGVRVGLTFTGWAFPSGHATAAIAVWGMLALIALGLAKRRAKRRRFLIVIGAPSPSGRAPHARLIRNTRPSYPATHNELAPNAGFRGSLGSSRAATIELSAGSI